MSRPLEPSKVQKRSNLYDIVGYKPSFSWTRNFTTSVVTICVGVTTWNLCQIIRMCQLDAANGHNHWRGPASRPPISEETVDGSSKQLAWSPQAQARAIEGRMIHLLSGMLTRPGKEFVTSDTMNGQSHVPLAHLGSDYFRMSSPNTTDLTRWRLDRRLGTYVIGNISYDSAEGRLAIGRNGYYFLYSQVNFIMAERDRPSKQSSIVKHQVVRRRRITHAASNLKPKTYVENEMVLLSAERTQSWAQGGSGTIGRCAMESSHVGAVVYLERGDRILVRVTDVNYIWQSPRRAIVGALYISD